VFEHLLNPEFDLAAEVSPTTLVDAQVRTHDWLSEDTAPTKAPDPASITRAQNAFQAIMDPAVPPVAKNTHILALRAPEAVRHLVGMLSGYDWNFIEQARELRGYVVAQLLEESTNSDARIRLQALKMIGSLTEVGSFTERIEVTRKNEDADIIEERLRAKLKSLLPPVMEVQTVQDEEIREIAVIPPTPQAPA
jgi:hypothetical protein